MAGIARRAHGVSAGFQRIWLLAIFFAAFYLAVALPWGNQAHAVTLPFGYEIEFSALAFQEMILTWGNWGVLGSILLMIVHSFIPFPAEFLAIANGVVWGPFRGTVITWIGAMGGAIITFWLVRMIGEHYVRRFVPARHWHRVDDWVERGGVRFFLIARLIPLISFDLLNMAAGLTRMTWKTFLWTTGLGIVPMTSLMVVMGDQIDQIPFSVWVLALVMVLILAVVARRGYGEVREF